MRMRKKKNLLPRMERCKTYLIENPYEMPGKWRALMPEAQELRVELGCGKGRFTVGTAQAEPGVLFIAVEMVPDAMVVAMERCKTAGLHNVFFVSANADQLPLFFQPQEIDRIYINFCDPWPTRRHAKRRLTHGNFLQLYRKVLKDGGQIHFKTDNQGLFEFSVEEIPQFGFTLSEVTRNLHGNGPVGVMTDYEAKFHELGQPINRCVATMIPWSLPDEIPYDGFCQNLSAHLGITPQTAASDHKLPLWKFLSSASLPCLKGDDARQALDALPDTMAYFFYEGAENILPYVRETTKVPAVVLDSKENLYLIGKDLSWVYVQPEETADGPFFYQTTC